ncbi:MAG: L,D-transpeptidase family protein [Pseudomonadales bacterium]
MRSALGLMLWLGLAAHAAAVPETGNQSGVYPLPDPHQRLIGKPRTITTVYSDTLADIALREGVGLDGLKRANANVDPWLPGDGTVLVLPTQMLLPDDWRNGITINLAERRLYYFDTANDRLLVYPVGIGVGGFETPLVTTRTVARIHKPSWTPTPAIRQERAAMGITLPAVVPPGPENPMGEYAIQLAEPGLFIHGTNRPLGVGQAVSHGCIRLFEAQIRLLATSVPNNTPVRIVNRPIKVLWHDDSLYLESHPAHAHTGSLSAMVEAIVQRTQISSRGINWRLAEHTAQAALGLPVRISTAPNDPLER